MKIDLLDAHLDSLGEDDFLLFIDAFDVVLFADERRIKEAFLAFQAKQTKPDACKVLVGAHGPPNPLMRYLMERNFMSDPKAQSLLCCGTFMGRVRDIKVLFVALAAKMKELQTYDDQIVFVSVFADQKEQLGMCLDEHSEVFATLCPPKNFGSLLAGKTSTTHLAVTKKLQVQNTSNKSFPVLIHAPGEANIDSFLQQLKYKIPRKSAQQHLTLVGKKIKFYANFVDKPRQAIVGSLVAGFVVLFIVLAAASKSWPAKSGFVTLMVLTLVILFLI